MGLTEKAFGPQVPESELMPTNACTGRRAPAVEAVVNCATA